MRFFDRIWANVDLDAINRNVNSIKKNLQKEVKILAVIKANAYGHGAFPIALELEQNDAIYGFAVATAEEGFSLREHGIHKPIIIIGYTFEENYEYLCEENIQTTVYTRKMVETLSEIANSKDMKIKVQIKVDTGMGRIGILPNEEGERFVKFVNQMSGIEIGGIFTHFANADTKDASTTEKQYQLFTDFVHSLEKQGICFPIKHCSNSAGTITYKNMNMDMVRAGIIIYGLWPSEEVDKHTIPLEPVLSLYSRIVHIKNVKKGTAISYGGTFITDREMKIATISAGYGDGYPRNLSSKGYVLIQGVKVPILGRICMDQFMVDVSKIDKVSIGDKVTLIGKEGTNNITFEDLANWGDGFNYELACNLNMRVPRIFLKNNQEKLIVDYLEQ
jgi:alanine racemase